MKQNPTKLLESIKAFASKGEPENSMSRIMATRGEGFEHLTEIPGFGNVGLSSFNMFYKSYIDKQHSNEIEKINEYRSMAKMSEIDDVIEDATNESTQVDHNNRVVNLEILDPSLSDNENILKNITSEFNELFYDRISQSEYQDIMRSYFIDGKVFYERIIDTKKHKRGIISIKKLPTETMDYIYNPLTGKVDYYFQYLDQNTKRPTTIEEAHNSDSVVVFNPEQISFVDYGVYGQTKYDVYGYLEKVKIPYNQLKLLETSVIIYRIIRAPERLVFRIDTGNMPREKALKYVEKIKQKMSKKQTYNSSTGQLTNEPEILCIRKNTEIPLLDGRNLSLEDIIKEHNEGKENWVYSINQDTLNIEPGKITNAAITRKNAELVRVHLDSGEYIDTTPDHKFILRDGSECRADELSKGTSLIPLYRKNKKLIYKKYGGYDYESIYNPGTNKWIWTHQMVTGSIDNGIVRHHIDYDRFNNNPTNIKLMETDEHFKHHQEVITSSWIDDPEGRTKSIRDGVKKWHSNPENKKTHSEWVTRTNIEQNKVAKMHEVLNTPEVRARQKEAVRKHMMERFSNPENRKKMKKIKSYIIDNKMISMMCDIFISNDRPKRDDLRKLLAGSSNFMDHFKFINEGQSFSNSQFNHINKNILKRMLEMVGFNDYPSFRKEFVLNHKVVKVEYLEEKDDTGCIEVEGNHNFAVSKNGKPLVYIRNSMLENFYLPQSADGRGSQIDTVGGNAAGFTELDDIYYFQRKLYRALKYPMSRATAGQENRSADIMFGGNSMEEIPRDEIKWSKFLERQQARFEEDFTDLFLLHLEFKGLKKEYGLDTTKLRCKMNPPSRYKEQMEARFSESRWNQYSMMADREELSKWYLMKKMLKWTDDDIMEMVEDRKKDKKYKLVPSEEDM